MKQVLLDDWWSLATEFASQYSKKNMYYAWIKERNKGFRNGIAVIHHSLFIFLKQSACSKYK